MLNKLLNEPLLKPANGSSIYYLQLFFMIIFLFSFKISLLSIGEAAIRLDDIFLVISSMIILYISGSYELKIYKFYLLYIIFCFYCLFAAFISSVFGRVDFLASTLFVLRLVQYSVFYFIGQYFYIKKYSIDKLFKIYIIFLISIIPMQYLQLVPIPGDFGSNRASGNANGPYELAVISAFMFFYFFNNFKENKFYCAASLLILYLTSSRITILAVLLIILYILIKKIPSFISISITAIFTIVIFLIFSTGLKFSNNIDRSLDKHDVLSRISIVDFGDLTEIFIESYRSSKVYENSKDYISGAYTTSLDNFSDAEGEVDVSAAIRFMRWSSLIKTSLSSVQTTIFGLGPSFGTIAVDGYLVRLLVETGILGLLIFLLFYFTTLLWVRKNVPWLNYYLIVLLLTSFFIDIFMSYKPMMLLWFSLGYFKRGVHRASN